MSGLGSFDDFVRARLPQLLRFGPAGRNLNWGYFGSCSQFQVGLHRLSASAPVGQPDMLYALRTRASTDTPSGVIASDLRL